MTSPSTPVTRQGGSYQEMPDGSLRQVAGTRQAGDGARAADGTPLDRAAPPEPPKRERTRRAPAPQAVSQEERASGATPQEERASGATEA